MGAVDGYAIKDITPIPVDDCPGRFYLLGRKPM
jgi:hypothetical protein